MYEKSCIGIEILHMKIQMKEYRLAIPFSQRNMPTYSQNYGYNYATEYQTKQLQKI